MSAGRRAAALAGAAATFVAAPAGADEALGRRLAALRALVAPARPSTAAVFEPRVARACVRGAWWRASEYGARARAEAAVRDASIRFDVEPGLIRSVIRQESAGDPEAVSSRGAMGLMQLMPRTAEALGVVCPFDPRANVLGGTRYLRALRNRFETWELALAAYNAGPARVEHGRVPRRTWRYVQRVMWGWRPLVVVRR